MPRTVREALAGLISVTDKTACAEEAADKLCAANGRGERVFEMFGEDIAALTGLNRTASEAIDMVDELSRYAGVEEMGQHPALTDLASGGRYFFNLMRGRHIEYCYAACLDEKKRLLRCIMLGHGNMSGSDVYIRDISGAVMRTGAKYVLLAHNHPGGTLKPSRADIEFTLRAAKALSYIGAELIEHIIVTSEAYIGIADGGYV